MTEVPVPAREMSLHESIPHAHMEINTLSARLVAWEKVVLKSSKLSKKVNK